MIRSGRGLTLMLSTALVALMVGGAGAAYAVGHGSLGVQQDGTPIRDAADSAGARPDAAVTGAGTTGVAHRTSAGGESRTAHTDSDSASPGPAQASTAGDTAPTTAGPVAVKLSPSAQATPHARDIADLISRYFTAINRHDYDAWLATVTTAQSQRDRDNWTVDYSTTKDSDVYISDITAGKPLTVRMQFISHQAISFAPPQLPAECVRWDVTYQVIDEGVGLRVGNSAKSPALAPC